MPVLFTPHDAAQLSEENTGMACPDGSSRRKSVNGYTHMQVNGEFPSTTRTLQEVGNLTIVHLNEQDAGLYECIASNLVADIIATALLVVHSRSSLDSLLISL